MPRKIACFSGKVREFLALLRNTPRFGVSGARAEVRFENGPGLLVFRRL